MRQQVVNKGTLGPRGCWGASCSSSHLHLDPREVDIWAWEGSQNFLGRIHTPLSPSGHQEQQRVLAARFRKVLLLVS